MNRRAIFLLVALAAAAGCGGGGGGATPPPSVASGSGSGANTSPNQTVQTTIRLTIKDGPATSAHGRAAQALAAQTNGIAITVYPTGATPPPSPSVLFSLSIFSGLCATNPDSSRTCTVTFPAPIGNDTFTVQTYDRGPLQVNGAPVAQGNVLATGSLVQTITAGANAIALAVNSVVSNVNLSWVGTPAFPFGTSTTAQFNVTGTDAAGNVVIGPWSPAVTLSASDPSVSLSATSLSSSPTSPLSATFSGAAIPEVQIVAAAGLAGAPSGVLRVHPDSGYNPSDGFTAFNQNYRHYVVAASPNPAGSPPAPGPTSSQDFSNGYFSQVQVPNATFSSTPNLIQVHSVADATPGPTAPPTTGPTPVATPFYPDHNFQDAWFQLAANGAVTNLSFFAFHNHDDDLVGDIYDQYGTYGHNLIDQLPEAVGASWAGALGANWTSVQTFPSAAPSPAVLVKFTSTLNRNDDGTYTRTNANSFSDGTSNQVVNAQRADGSTSMVRTGTRGSPYTRSYSAPVPGPTPGTYTQTYNDTTNGVVNPPQTYTVPIPAAYMAAPWMRYSFVVSGSAPIPSGCFLPSGNGIPATATRVISSHFTRVDFVTRSFNVSDQNFYSVTGLGTVCSYYSNQSGSFDSAGNWSTDVVIQYSSLNQVALNARLRHPLSVGPPSFFGPDGIVRMEARAERALAREARAHPDR